MARQRTTGQSRNDYIPSDYEDLYRYYILGDGHGNSLVQQIIRKMMPYSDLDERETLSHEVFLRCIEKDVIVTGGSSSSSRAKELGKTGKFEPSKANFGGVMFFVTRTVVTGHLSKKSRNPLTGLNGGSLASKDMEDDVFEPGVYSLDRLFGTDAPNYEEQMYARKLLGELIDWAKCLYDNPRHKRDESLYPLINLLSDQHDAKECGAQLGVTPSTISNWMEVLRKKLHEIADQYA